ncbi:MAG: Phosphomannomutase [Planctomycetota bacterium]|nr:MAG: Phosphomannomutase [Planctomycetota bacterium]
MLSLLPTLEPQYVCPGETHAISRAVHLSRLAAFYPKCRECPHRQEIGQLPQPQFEEPDSSQPRISERSLFTLEGVRGVYLNELTRHKAGELSAAFASLLWESLPLAGRSDLRDANSKRPIRRSGPVVVVGFDERSSSPDIVTGVASALRRMSCQVVDVGQTSLPCFRFAVAHMQAAGGILISGHGCEPSWTGLDFVAKQGRPISVAGRNREARSDSRDICLDDIHERCELGAVRPLRQGGSQRVFQASVPYLAGLLKHFHALRPLRVAIGCPVRFVRQTLDALFEKLPVTLDWVELPQRRRDLLNADDPDVRRVREAVVARSADFGLVIDDDGANVAVLDELGGSLTPADLLCLLADVLPATQAEKAIVIDNAARDLLQPRVAARGWRCWLGGWTQSDIWQALRHDAATCGGGATGRVWLRDSVPTCDAILTLAQLLQALSRDDAPLSSVVESAAAA